MFYPAARLFVVVAVVSTVVHMVNLVSPSLLRFELHGIATYIGNLVVGYPEVVDASIRGDTMGILIKRRIYIPDVVNIAVVDNDVGQGL